MTKTHVSFVFQISELVL